MGFGLYIHIPFCLKKCDYCSFYSVNFDENLASSFLKRLVDESDEFSKSNYEFDTIYIGGGTPSTLEPTSLTLSVRGIFERLKFNHLMEFTLEINPGTIDKNKLFLYKSAGVSRISIGLQRLDNDELHLLGRIHSAMEAIESVEMAYDAGFSNISADIIYGIPEDTPKKVEKLLERIVRLPVVHISAYSLTYDEGTRFFEKKLIGEFKPIPEDEEFKIYRLIQEYLGSEGFKQYEISSFAKPGFESVHNRKYWAQESYLGLGPSAVSTDYNNYVRWTNPPDLRNYLFSPRIARKLEHLNKKGLLIERIFLSLRTVYGLDIERLAKDFEVDIDDFLPPIFLQKGFIVKSGARMRIPAEHFFIADEIISGIIKNI
ncbi:MAG: radical SAM family heme chaperone HemW [bacterium]